MASIYKRPPFYKGEKKWVDNNTLSEVYNLRSNNPKTKTLLKSTRIMEVTPSSSPSTRWSPSLIREQRNVNSPGSTPSRSSRTCCRDSTWLRGSRRSTSTFRSPSTQQGQFRANKIVTWMKTFVEPSRSFFSGRWMRKSLEIGNTLTYSPEEIISSKRQWWRSQSIILVGSKRCFAQLKPFRLVTCLRPTTHTRLSGFTCLFIWRTATGTSRVDDASAMKHSRLLDLDFIITLPLGRCAFW